MLVNRWRLVAPGGEAPDWLPVSGSGKYFSPVATWRLASYPVSDWLTLLSMIFDRRRLPRAWNMRHFDAF
jgi:hypothetical protein